MRVRWQQKWGALWLVLAIGLAACTEHGDDESPVAQEPGAETAANAARTPGASDGHQSETAARPDPFDQLLSMLDTDRDGRVSVDEHARGARDMFRRMDRDGDGTVTVEEMDAVRSGLDDAEGESRERLREVDLDGNGSLSAEEHLAATRIVFDASDTDKNGMLERDEAVRQP